MVITYRDDLGLVSQEVDGNVGMVVLDGWIHFTTPDGIDMAVRVEHVCEIRQL